MIKLTVQNRQAKVWGVRGALHHRASHQGAEGAGARPGEDEEHQAQR